MNTHSHTFSLRNAPALAVFTRTFAMMFIFSMSVLSLVPALQAQSAPVIPPKPEAPDSFVMDEANNFIKTFDAYVEEYIATAQAARRSRNAQKLNTLAQTKGTQIQKVGETIAATTLFEPEIERFSEYTALQSQRMIAASEAAYTADPQFANSVPSDEAPAPKPSAATVAPNATPKQGTDESVRMLAAMMAGAGDPGPIPPKPARPIFASAEMNDLMKTYEPLMEEYFDALVAMRKGDSTKLTALESKIKQMGERTQKVQPTLSPEDEKKLAAYIFAQGERFSAVMNTAKQ